MTTFQLERGVVLDTASRRWNALMHIPPTCNETGEDDGRLPLVDPELVRLDVDLVAGGRCFGKTFDAFVKVVVPTPVHHVDERNLVGDDRLDFLISDGALLRSCRAQAIRQEFVDAGVAEVREIAG